MIVKSDMSWNNVIRPYKSCFVEKDNEEFFGSLALEPLTRGFGVTLGNAMRRILLSSIESAAVTSCKIQGVSQEFSSIPGVLEDVTDIVINLKNMHVGLVGDARGQRFSLTASGAGPVYAEQIQGATSLTIVNPKHKICTLTEDVTFSMEIGVERGVGYVPSEDMVSQVVGDILIDAQFSPVVDVNFRVESMTMGADSNVERLILDVETNGIISPRDAVESAGKILMDQASRFVSLDDSNEAMLPVEPVHSSQNVEANPILYQRIQDMQLKQRCLTCLEKMGDVHFVGDLIQKTESELRQTPHLGEKSITDIKEFLASHGLSLGIVLNGWSVKNGTPTVTNEG